MQFDWFIDTVPQVIERVQQAEKRGKEEGNVEGNIEGKMEQARQDVVEVVQVRFPTLANFAQTQVASITQLTQLCKLMRDLIQASDEVAAVYLLTAKGA
ncbi:hypothetical protein KSF_082780 [Reticulibacter mediterranei]|uniref:Uncharacterized protein n=2 Tax=Reticulibacter mediterranei TaxID=2778369 RepID=A0A8J3N795_9CHLR|nr:hypothetical protein KSF_082780 [Reticulibacter mediterranei]